MTLTVKELIKELQKYPKDSVVGFYPENAGNLGDPMWLNRIKRTSLCKDGITVQLIGGVA
jgi:hypothetical protein